MRSLIVLVVLWLAFQLGGLLMGDRRARDPSPWNRPSTARVEGVLREWPAHSRNMARTVMSEYGLPDGASPNVMWWDQPGDVGIVLYRGDDSVRSEMRPAAMAMLSMKPGDHGRPAVFLKHPSRQSR